MARLKSAFTDLPDAPSADLIDHGRFTRIDDPDPNPLTS
jgi:hypothetical protein